MTRPERHIPYDPEGLNRGTTPDVAARQLVTPPADFFRRNHAAFPAIDPTAWRLEVGGLVHRPATYLLEELVARFPQHEVVATMVCAGMRRAEYLALGSLHGELPWGPDAASTGAWTGVRLGDVLREAGVRDDARYVHFEGLDDVERHGRRFGFGASIDLEKAEADEVLLATHLGGAPLAREHGFPLRAVVPGWIGARSVKWLGRITVSDEPSRNYFETDAYRVQRERNPDDPRDVRAGVALDEIPLNAVVIEPRADDVLPAGRVRVRGWAIGQGGRPLTAVEVSADGGATWTCADVVATEGAWAWTFWEAVVHLAPGTHVLVARARDTAGEMPETLAETWNVKGYANNAWYRVPVTVE